MWLFDKTILGQHLELSTRGRRTWHMNLIIPILHRILLGQLNQRRRDMWGKQLKRKRLGSRTKVFRKLEENTPFRM